MQWLLGVWSGHRVVARCMGVCRGCVEGYRMVARCMEGAWSSC